MKKLVIDFVIITLLLIIVIFNNCTNEDKSKISAPPASYNPDFAVAFYDLACKIVKNTDGFFPPQASRAYGYISLSFYESIIRGISPDYTLEGRINGLKLGSLPKPIAGVQYNWAISANAAISEMMRKMFEINISAPDLEDINLLEKQNKMKLSEESSKKVIERSEKYGKSVAAALYIFSTGDGGHHSYLNPFQLSYNSNQEPGKWVPTSSRKTPLAPAWGSNRPFLITNITETEPPEFYTFSTDPDSKIYKDALEVYNQVKNNSSEQILIANYWADDPFNTCTPSGHTFNILKQLVLQTKASLARTAIAYCKVGIAENDAFIACWKCKYKYNSLRPVTYIQQCIDPAFLPLIRTPPFPSYISAHSAEIGAASKIFSDMFTNGDGNFYFSDQSLTQNGFEPRSFKNFDEMALECSNSRFYGGIHFLMDNVCGLKLGQQIGNNVNKLINWPKNVR